MRRCMCWVKRVWAARSMLSGPRDYGGVTSQRNRSIDLKLQEGMMMGRCEQTMLGDDTRRSCDGAFAQEENPR
jgi:hypothetical protein